VIIVAVATDSVERVDTRRSEWRRSRVDPATVGPVVLFALLIVVFGLISPDVFLTQGNFTSILNEGAILAILACGLTVVLLAGEFDLSLGSAASFGGALSAVLIARSGQPLAITLVVIVAAGVVIGLVNGLLVTWFRVPALIATLAVASLLDGFSQLVTDNKTIFSGFSESFVNTGRWTLGDVQAPVFYLVVIAVVLWVCLRYTLIGRQMHAVGGNRAASRMCGIHVERTVIVAFVVSGVLASIAGALYTARQGSFTPMFGTSFLLPAFAAAFLGSVTLRRGAFHIVGTVIGVFLIGTGTTGLLITGGPTYTQQLFAGAVLILATGGTRFIGQRSATRAGARRGLLRRR